MKTNAFESKNANGSLDQGSRLIASRGGRSLGVSSSTFGVEMVRGI
jgi:hypothetical protein